MPSTLESQVKEDHGPDQSIKLLPVARTAFVGRTLRGPEARPVLVRNFSEFQQIFGGLWQPSLLGYAVEQFFDNGGREALVVRVVNGARAATLCLPAGKAQLVLQALRPGTREFLRASVDYDNLPDGSTNEFNLTLQRIRTQGTLRVEDQESLRAVSVDPQSKKFLAIELAKSQLVRLNGEIPTVRPQRTLDAQSGLASGYVHSNSDGDDGAPLTDYDLIGSVSERTGLFALDAAAHFSFLCIPPISRERDLGITTLVLAARYCRSRHALLIVDPPVQWHSADDALRGMRKWGFASEDACMYFPRILALDKLRGHFEAFAPCGAVAGMLSRADTLTPVWAEHEPDEPVLRPGFRPSCLVAADRRAKLAAIGINTIHAVRTAVDARQSLRTFGAAQSAAADWKYLASRRFALSVVKSVELGTRWAAPLRGPLPAQQPTSSPVAVCALVETQVRAFLHQLLVSGAFGSRRAEEAYFVICDARVHGRAGAAEGLALLIGMAAERLGDFHCFRVTHRASRSETQSVTLNRLSYQQYSPVEIEWVDRLAQQLQHSSSRADV
jgi:hypothetical protein